MTGQPIARELADDLDNLGANLQTGQPPKPLPKDFAAVNSWEGAQPDGASDRDANSWILFYLNALVDQVKLAHDAVARLERKEGG